MEMSDLQNPTLVQMPSLVALTVKAVSGGQGKPPPPPGDTLGKEPGHSVSVLVPGGKV